MLKLHLGCGTNYKDDWVNVDSVNSMADESVDLTELPWHWCDASVDEVLMEHVLEHFAVPELVLKEIHRILKPNGVVTITVPHAEAVTACNLDHKSFLTCCFFRGFSMKSPHYWVRRNNCMFEEVSYRVRLYKIGPLRWTPLDPLASRFPFFWEKVSFGMFRPTEITWVGRKSEPDQTK